MILLGLLLLAAAIALTAYNIWDGKRAKDASDTIAAELDDRMPEPTRAPEFEPNPTEMPTEEIDGYLYIGELDIPSRDLHLPVMADWDYERLRISPCRYSGSYYTDDLVICAHNYARHFSPIRWVEPGEEVYFTNVEGKVYRYEVTNRETVQPTSISQMIENQNNSLIGGNGNAGDWDLTLFTCNTGGQTRCAVRCARVADEN